METQKLIEELKALSLKLTLKKEYYLAGKVIQAANTLIEIQTLKILEK